MKEELTKIRHILELLEDDVKADDVCDCLDAIIIIANRIKNNHRDGRYNKRRA